MPYVVIQRYNRPNNSVNWPHQTVLDDTISDNYAEMIFTDFHSRKSRNVSETNELTLEVEFVWESKETYDDFSSRPETIAMHQEVSRYIDSVGITTTKDEFEI